MFLSRKIKGKVAGGGIGFPLLPISPKAGATIINPFLLPGSTTLTPIYFGNKNYELSDWLGNVRVVITDKKYAVNNGNTTISYMPIIASITDYYSFGSQIAERTYDPVKPAYRFGFNTQEKVFEITQDHYTAKFWEYDARLGRRWNVDPKPTTNESVYATNKNNSIWYFDLLGDTVRTNKEGFENTTMAMKGILDGKANPIGFDEKRGILTYDDKIDISNYSDFQKEILGRYKELITNKTDVKLNIVDMNEKLDDLDGKSLMDKGFVGLTVPYKKGDIVVYQNVYIARNPVKSDRTTPEKKEYAGIINIHELAGHAYLNITQPTLKKNEHNKLVEELHKQVFQNFKINGAIWYKRSAVPTHNDK